MTGGVSPVRGVARRLPGASSRHDGCGQQTKEEQLRRLAVVLTVMAVLAGAGAAYAAINTYTASMKFTSKQAGTPAKPLPIGYTEALKVTGTDGNRAGVRIRSSAPRFMASSRMARTSRRAP